MVNRNNRTQALTAKSATIIFIAYFIAQLLCVALLETIGGVSLRPLEELLIPIVGCVVMVSMAFKLMPKDLEKNDPMSPAWKLGNRKNLFKGLGIGCVIGIGSYFWGQTSPSHSLSHSFQKHLVEPVSQMVVTPGAQQVLAIVLLALFGPAVEEMMFRGILYGGYRKSFGPWWALLITTGLFVAIHFPYYIYVPYRILPYIVASLALLWCRLRWKAIGPAITAHSGINIVSVIIPSLILTWQNAFYESGIAEYKASNFNQAIASLTHSIQLGDNSSQVYIYRGNAKLEGGDLDGAISDYNKAIELDPSDGAGFRDRGLAKYRKSDFEGAIADYGEVIALHPKDGRAYNERGLARIHEVELEAAMADFGQAIELNPTNSLYYNNRGWTEFMKGDFDSSITDATRSIQLDPNPGYAYSTRGWARYGQGDISDATEDCKKAIELFQQGSAPDFSDQGLLDFIAGDYEKAIAVWQKAIQKDVTIKFELQPWIEKARAKLQKKPVNADDQLVKMENEASFYMQAQQTNRAIELLQDTARFCVQTDHYPEPEGVLQKLTVAEPNQPEPWYDLSRLEMLLGKKDEAIKDLQNSINLSDQRLKTNPAALDIRNAARTEASFDPIHNSPDFQKLVSQ